MIIRDYNPNDFETLYRIDNVCFPKGIAYTRLELKFYIAFRRSLTLVAENSYAKEVLGFIIACKEQDKIGHIITIDVMPEHRRKQVGSQLLMAAERELSEKGITTIYLETSVENQPAIGFYRRHHYVIADKLPRYYMGKIDAYLLMKSIGSDND